jgi:DNA modification methylase
VIKPVYGDEDFVLFHENCRKVLPMLADDSVDSIVCDPPYDLTAGKKGGTGEASLNMNSPAGRSRISTGNNGGFMGMDWDSTGVAFDPATWRECLRVLKPGGHLVAFGGTRTYHRMACAIEDAGFEIRDSLHWLYGSGFPKGLDVSKAIDKAAGAEREVTGTAVYGDGHVQNSAESIGSGGSDPLADRRMLTAPATDAARQWSGWNVALKPGHEPIVLARKPLSEKTVAANVLKHGTGSMNIDGCRVSGEVPVVPQSRFTSGNVNIRTAGRSGELSEAHDAGRWPPNILLTHSAACVPAGEKKVRNASGSIKGDEPSAVTDAVYAERVPWQAHGDADGMETVQAYECAEDCPVGEMDRQSGQSKSQSSSRGERHDVIYGGGKGPSGPDTVRGHEDSGGASRFFPQFEPDYDFPYLYCAKAPKKERPKAEGSQAHPTVKPLSLMRWLVRLVTPPKGVVLDLFCGTGTTLQASRAEGFRSIGIDSWEDAIAQACARLGIEREPDEDTEGTGDTDAAVSRSDEAGVQCGAAAADGAREGE